MAMDTEKKGMGWYDDGVCSKRYLILCSYHAVFSIILYALNSDGYLDFENSETQHVAHTVRGDCM